MSDDVKILNQANKYKGYVSVENVELRHRLLSGKLGPSIKRDMIRVNRAVSVLPYDPVRDEVIFIRQFRVGVWGAGVAPWLEESVAGVIDPGEVPEATARRETIEETGCVVSDLKYICEYFPSPGVITEHLTLYCGIVDTENAGGHFGLEEEGEDIEAIVKPWDEAWSEVENGRLFDAKLLLSMMWLSQKKESLFHCSQTGKEPV